MQTSINLNDQKFEAPSGSPMIQRLWNTAPFLTVISGAHIIMTLVLLALLPFDSRTILNEAVWIKPIKFTLSTVIYTATIAWLLSYITHRPWIKRIVAGSTGILLASEIGIVIYQAGRGVRSHYNITTPFDEVLWGMMGTMIMLLWVTNFVLLLLLLFQKLPSRAFKWSLVSGLIIAIVGGLVAFPMTSQTTAAQQEVFDNGGRPDAVGAHTIGAEDGGPGLPFVGWSTTHGDLRPAHFVGLHGLQMLPLLGFWINRRWRHLGEACRTGLVLIGAAGYLAFIYALFQQAMRGYSIISFDLQTMSILGVASLITCAAWMMTVWSGNKVSIYQTQRLETKLRS
ncbi:MAG: hypothetical protein AAF633_04465 [Chloroflexota bacterium]